MTTPALSHPAALDHARELYEEGRYLDACEAGGALGDLHAWIGTRARILAARIAARLGAAALSQALFRKAWQGDRRDPEAFWFYANLLFRRRGPWHLLRWLHHAEARPTTAEVLGLEAHAYACLRDFERARERFEEASRLAPASPWLHVERACAFEQEDRIDDALAACAEALALRPHYRPAAQTRARLLAHAGRPEEALAALDAAPHAAQSWEMLSLRAELARRLGRWDRCAEDLAAARVAATLADPGLIRGLAASESEALYMLGRHRAAEAKAREADTPYTRSFAEALAHLAEGAPPSRVELPVPHIRQHHQTCAPASLAQVTGFHGDPVDHLALAAEICYAGTPAHRSRVWAEARGYAVREFDLSFEAARALIDAGLPFLLTTADTTSAHAQVVIGYDLVRRTILLRDPSLPYLVEAITDALIADQAWSGPHAMALAPPARAAALAAIDLPASAAWDVRHRVSLALERHDLAAAEDGLRELDASAPGSRLALVVSLAVASYRGEVDAQLDCIDALLALYPDAGCWVLRRGERMQGRRPRAERLSFWAARANRADPAMLVALAEELRFDGATEGEAARLLRRVLRVHPTEALAHHVYADLVAARGDDPTGALESYRFAACADTPNEHFARAYFDHARLCGREGEALALLEKRVERTGGRASGPAWTLFEAWSDQGNPERGLSSLTALAKLRPEDGDLATALALAHLRNGEVAEARAWLDRGAAAPAAPVERALAEAQVAHAEGRVETARTALERAVAEAPDRVDALARYAVLLYETEGRAATLAALEAARARRPSHGAILQELCVWLRGVDDARARALLDEHVRAHPDDAWSRRELACTLQALGLSAEALAVARATVEALPHDSWALSVLGGVLDHAGQHDEARAALRRAVELDVDNVGAIRQFETRPCGDDERREDARFVLDALAARVSAGHGLSEASRLAACLPDAERAERLGRLLERTPHRPDAWEAVARTRVELDDLDGAEEITRRACERFPRWHSLRLLRATVLRLRGDARGAEAALREICDAAPVWENPRVELSALLDARGDTRAAVAVIEEGLRRAPRSVRFRVERAYLHWSEGARGAAFDVLLALLRERDCDAATFQTLCSWAGTLERTAEVESALRDRLAREPLGALPALWLGTVITAPERAEERVAALREALSRAPRSCDAADLLAETLSLAGRHDEALAVCPPAGWTGAVPVTLQGRRVWVRARRGEVSEAIVEMLALLAQEPRYDWGRRALCDWLEAQGRAEEFVTHATALVQSSPRFALHHTYLGDAKRLAGDPHGAREAFERSLALNPADAYTVSRAVELLLDGSRVADASAHIERARHALPAHLAAKLDLDVAAAARAREDALGAFERLLSSRAPLGVLEAALAALARCSWCDAALRRVEDHMRGDGADDPTPGHAWAWARETLRPEGALRILAEPGRLGLAGRVAVAGLLDALARRGERATLAWLGARHFTWLRADVTTWGAFGRALLALGWRRACVWWLSDWRGRPALTAWSLLSLAVALWILGRRREVAAVTARALELPRDASSDRHRAHEAFERALSGDFEMALRLARSLPRAEPSVRGLVALVEALASGSGRPRATAIEQLPDMTRTSLAEASALAENDAMLRAACSEALTVILDGHPRRRADFWSWGSGCRSNGTTSGQSLSDAEPLTIGSSSRSR